MVTIIRKKAPNTKNFVFSSKGAKKYTESTGVKVEAGVIGGNAEFIIKAPKEQFKNSQGASFVSSSKDFTKAEMIQSLAYKQQISKGIRRDAPNYLSKTTAMVSGSSSRRSGLVEKTSGGVYDTYKISQGRVVNTGKVSVPERTQPSSLSNIQKGNFINYLVPDDNKPKLISFEVVPKVTPNKPVRLEQPSLVEAVKTDKQVTKKGIRGFFQTVDIINRNKVIPAVIPAINKADMAIRKDAAIMSTQFKFVGGVFDKIADAVSVGDSPAFNPVRAVGQGIQGVNIPRIKGINRNQRGIKGFLAATSYYTPDISKGFGKTLDFLGTPSNYPRAVGKMLTGYGEEYENKPYTTPINIAMAAGFSYGYEGARYGGSLIGQKLTRYLPTSLVSKTGRVLEIGVPAALATAYGANIASRLYASNDRFKTAGGIIGTEILPFAAGSVIGTKLWRGSLGLYTRMTAEEIAAQRIVRTDVLSGKKKFPEARSAAESLAQFKSNKYALEGPNTINKFTYSRTSKDFVYFERDMVKPFSVYSEKATYLTVNRKLPLNTKINIVSQVTGKPVSSGKLQTYHATTAMFGKEALTQKGTSASEGLYVAPSVSQYFLRLGKESKTEYGLIPKPISRPNIVSIKIAEVLRLPEYLRRNVKGANEFLAKQSGKDRSYITPEREMGKPESESVIPKDTLLKRSTASRYNKYVELKGEAVPIQEFEIGKGRRSAKAIREDKFVRDIIDRVSKSNEKYYSSKNYQTVYVPYVSRINSELSKVSSVKYNYFAGRSGSSGRAPSSSINIISVPDYTPSPIPSSSRIVKIPSYGGGGSGGGSSTNIQRYYSYSSNKKITTITTTGRFKLPKIRLFSDKKKSSMLRRRPFKYQASLSGIVGKKRTNKKKLEGLTGFEIRPVPAA